MSSSISPPPDGPTSCTPAGSVPDGTGAGMEMAGSPAALTALLNDAAARGWAGWPPMVAGMLPVRDQPDVAEASVASASHPAKRSRTRQRKSVSRSSKATYSAAPTFSPACARATMAGVTRSCQPEMPPAPYR